MDRVGAFWLGNVVGLTLLIACVVLTAPQKLRETELAKQKGQSQDIKASKPSNAPVIVAAINIKQGQTIARSFLTVVTLPALQIVAGSVSNIDMIVGHSAKSDISKGSQITNKVISH